MYVPPFWLIPFSHSRRTRADFCLCAGIPVNRPERRTFRTVHTTREPKTSRSLQTALSSFLEFAGITTMTTDPCLSRTISSRSRWRHLKNSVVGRPSNPKAGVVNAEEVEERASSGEANGLPRSLGRCRGDHAIFAPRRGRAFEPRGRGHADCLATRCEDLRRPSPSRHGSQGEPNELTETVDDALNNAFFGAVAIGRSRGGRGEHGEESQHHGIFGRILGGCQFLMLGTR